MEENLLPDITGHAASGIRLLDAVLLRSHLMKGDGKRRVTSWSGASDHDEEREEERMNIGGTSMHINKCGTRPL